MSETSAICRCSLTSGVSAVSFRHDAALANLVPETHEFKQNYFLTTFITAIVLGSLLCTFYLRQQDKIDNAQIARICGWKLDVVQQVAD